MLQILTHMRKSAQSAFCRQEFTAVILVTLRELRESKTSTNANHYEKVLGDFK